MDCPRLSKARLGIIQCMLGIPFHGGKGLGEVEMVIYLIGSLNNPRIPLIGNELRTAGFEVFDDWYAAGYEADKWWRAYEISKGNGVKQALASHSADHVFQFDYKHLQRADMVVLVMPAGNSGHLEFGWARGAGKPGFILFDEEPKRYDVMWKFATNVFFSVQELIQFIYDEQEPKQEDPYHLHGDMVDYLGEDSPF